MTPVTPQNKLVSGTKFNPSTDTLHQLIKLRFKKLLLFLNLKTLINPSSQSHLHANKIYHSSTMRTIVRQWKVQKLKIKQSWMNHLNFHWTIRSTNNHQQKIKEVLPKTFINCNQKPNSASTHQCIKLIKWFQTN